MSIFISSYDEREKHAGANFTLLYFCCACRVTLTELATIMSVFFICASNFYFNNGRRIIQFLVQARVFVSVGERTHVKY